MGALRKLTRQQDPAPYIRMLTKAHHFSATIFGENMESMEAILTNANAFKEHNKAKLRLPEEVL